MHGGGFHQLCGDGGRHPCADDRSQWRDNGASMGRTPEVSGGGRPYRPAVHPLCGRSPAWPGRCAGRHERLRLRSTRAPAHVPPRSARDESSGDGAGAGARGRSLASAVPSQRRHFVSRRPPTLRLRPRAASRETSGMNAGDFRRYAWSIVGWFSMERDRVFGRKLECENWCTWRVVFRCEVVYLAGGFGGDGGVLGGWFSGRKWKGVLLGFDLLEAIMLKVCRSLSRCAKYTVTKYSVKQRSTALLKIRKGNDGDGRSLSHLVRA